MTFLAGPQAFFQIAYYCLQQVNDDLQDDAVQRVVIYPGDIVWDECECGMLAASVASIIPSNDFPNEAAVTPCGAATLVATINFALVRCAPQPPDGMAEVGPAADELNAAAALSISDQWHLVESVDCALNQLTNNYGTDPQIMDSLIRPAVSIGPRGDCVGSQLQAFVQISRGVFT